MRSERDQIIDQIDTLTDQLGIAEQGWQQEREKADALRAEGAATERARILAIIDRELALTRSMSVSMRRADELRVMNLLRAEIEGGAGTGEKEKTDAG